MIKRTIPAAAVLLASIFTSGSLQAATLMSVAYGTITGVAQQQRDT